jgi:hypothetical protein
LVGLDGFETATPKVRANICNDHDQGVAAPMQVASVIEISFNANRHKPKAAVHSLSPPIRRPDLELHVHDTVLNHCLGNEGKQQGGCMPVPRLVGGNGDVGYPTRSTIDPGCGMTDDGHIVFRHKMDSIGALNFIEKRSERPGFAVRSCIDHLQRCNIGLFE